MTDTSLITDAELVADAAVRLGRPTAIRLADAIKSIRSDDAHSAHATAELRVALGSTVRDIAPVTLGDLRSGWKPYDDHPTRSIAVVFFGIFALALLVYTANVTQSYNRAKILQADALTLENAHGAEQAIRLFGLLKKNQKDVIESLNNGTKDFMYEAFNKALSDLVIMNTRAQAFYALAAQSICDLHSYTKPQLLIPKSVRDLYNSSEEAPECSSSDIGNTLVSKWSKNYTSGLNSQTVSLAQAGDGSNRPIPLKLENMDVQDVLGLYFTNVRSFTSAINVSFDPVHPIDYSYYVDTFNDALGILGSWVLPFLYGMLGAVMFLMRRLLDTALPNPPWLRFPFRIILGGLAGLVVVELWPNGQAQFIPLGAFGVSFVIGYSTDILFLWLDRLVASASQSNKAQ